MALLWTAVGALGLAEYSDQKAEYSDEKAEYSDGKGYIRTRNTLYCILYTSVRAIRYSTLC